MNPSAQQGLDCGINHDVRIPMVSTGLYLVASHTMSSPPSMNETQRKPLWTPEIARRTKAQVLQEEWGTTDDREQSERRFNIDKSADSSLETWTTLRSRPLSLFYQAPSCPPIPFMKEIRHVTPDNRLHEPMGNHLVSKLGATVVKWGYSSEIVEVSRLDMFTIVVCFN